MLTNLVIATYTVLYRCLKPVHCRSTLTLHSFISGVWSDRRLSNEQTALPYKNNFEHRPQASLRSSQVGAIHTLIFILR
jgi:hypothetical protein